MNQRLKRMISGILAVLTLFTTLFADWTPVFAASPSANMSFWYASVKDHDIITGFSKTHIKCQDLMYKKYYIKMYN